MYNMILKGFEILRQNTHKLGVRRRVFICRVQQQRCGRNKKGPARGELGK